MTEAGAADLAFYGLDTTACPSCSRESAGPTVSQSEYTTLSAVF